MNTKRVNEWILPAKNALETLGIAKDGKVDKTFRGQISSFGAAVVMGSFRSAVAFFAEQGGASVARENLIKAMYLVITGEEKEPKDILRVVCETKENELKELKEKFIDASVALKLAMNFFELIKGE